MIEAIRVHSLLDRQRSTSVLLPTCRAPSTTTTRVSPRASISAWWMSRSIIAVAAQVEDDELGAGVAANDPAELFATLGLL